MRILLLTLLLSTLPAAICGAAEPLPRVLILGDFVYNEPSRTLAREQKGRLEVVYRTVDAPEVASSTVVRARLKELLGDQKWDLIHFNCGLADLVHRLPGSKSFRVMARKVGGVRNTSPDQYEENLKAIVKQLKATGAVIVWASTTPIRSTPNDIFEMGVEQQYNDIAQRVMRQKGVAINDMYAHVKAAIDMNKPASHGFDPFSFDRKPIHGPIAAIIYKELKIPVAAEDQ